MFCPLGISETALPISWQDGSQGVKSAGVDCHGTVKPWNGGTRSLVTCWKTSFCLGVSENQGAVGSKSTSFATAYSFTYICSPKLSISGHWDGCLILINGCILNN